MNQSPVKRKLAAILSADVAGYCCLMQDDEEETIHSLNKYKEILFGLVKGYNGRIVDSPGDNILAEFSSVVDAVKCSIQIQEEFRAYNEELPKNRKMEFRIGINTGDVIQDGNGIYGDGVNVTARIESLADPGGVCISRTAYDQVKKKVKIDYEYLGEFEVKNIDEPVRIYKILFKYSSNKSELRDKLIEKAIIKTRKYSLSDRPSIAVLPFVNLSSDKEQEYFVDGLSEEILNRLSHIPDLRVIARTSSFSFKGTNKTIQSIAGILGVDNILEGSVRKSGKAIRISTQLIKGEDGSHLWSETYKRELKDIFEVQEEIAVTVARELKLTLGIDEAIQNIGGTDNLEAYELFLIVRGKIWQIERGYEFSNLLEMIDKSIALDPDFALAWAAKSIIHYNLVAFGPLEQADEEKMATFTSAQKAIELEPNLADGYSALSRSNVMRCKWVDAEIASQKALELQNGRLVNPKYMSLATYNNSGRAQKCIEILEEIRRNDPLNTGVCSDYFYNSGLLGNMVRAETEYKRGRTIFGDKWDQGNAKITYLRLDSRRPFSSELIEHSTPVFEITKRHLDSSERGLTELKQLYGDASRLSESYITDIMVCAAYFGDIEFSMDAMEQGIKINAAGLFKAWPSVMRTVRQSSRFKEFAREIGLVNYWNEFGWSDLFVPTGENDFKCC